MKYPEAMLEVPLLDWQKVKIDEALAAYEANPQAVYTWEDVLERVRSRHARSR